MQALIGQKKVQSQRFLENGRRIPVTLIDVKDNCVFAVKTTERDHYQALQLGYGIKKNANKAQIGHAKGAKRDTAPKFLREVRIHDDSPLPSIGDVINPSEVFAPGDIVDVVGFSKGKGFAGGVRRYGFRGGPKTHGQSDRHRAPGSIGQGTTPGRVYRGKRMAGKMGNENVTIQNLKIVDVTNDGVLIIEGLVPGVINSLIYIEKVGTDKKFVPLWKEASAEQDSDVPVVEPVEEKAEEPKEEVKVDEVKVEASLEKNSEEQAVEVGSVEEVPAEVKEEVKIEEVAEDAR